MTLVFPAVDDFKSQKTVLFQIHSEGHRFCKNKRHNVSGLFDLFHLAPDGLLHFTDLHNDIRHLDKKGSPEFCIEALHHEVTWHFNPEFFKPKFQPGYHESFHPWVINDDFKPIQCTEVRSSKSSGKETGKMPLYSVSVCITNFVTGWILLSWNILGNNFEILKVWGSSAGLWGDDCWWSSLGGSCRFYWGLALLGSCWENKMAFYQKSSEGYFLGLWEVCWGSTQRYTYTVLQTI